MNKYINLLFIFIFLPVQVLYSQTTVRETGIIYLKSNLGYLASDELEGRETATRGAYLAGNFISAELEKYGIKPFGDNDTYFQSFNISVKNVTPESKLSFINDDGTSKELLVGEDIFLSMENEPAEKYNDLKSDIVFAGYGISANGYDYDDYREVDANGKVVLLMSGNPPNKDESLFSNEDEKKFSDRNYKYENAVNHGAVGIIYIPAGWILKYWEFMKKRALTPSVGLTEEKEGENKVESEAIPVVVLSKEAAIELLSDEKYSYEAMLTQTEEGSIPEGFNLMKKVQFSYRINKEIKQARNVVGIIEGTDAELKNEYIVLSAHYDHEGIVNDVIYNGADDDGSGTVAILEAARRFALLNANDRSIVIAFHTGEEKGLLGSKYLTNNSNFMKDVVANINIDMVGRESIDTIYSIGSNKLSSEMHELVEEVNSETVQFVFDYTFDDPNDPNRYYYRSDHYNYAKQNIPIVFFYDHMTEDYHKPTDDVDKINFEKIEKVSTLITELAIRIANLDHRLIVDKLEEKVDTN